MIVEFVAGLLALGVGAELLVRGASGIARRLGVTPLVIGLTVVAFGTSTPELVVSVAAAVQGRASLAVGNVVGSNVFNVLFILGVCALLSPLAVASALIRRDVPIMMGTSLVVWCFALDGRFSLVESSVLLAGLVAFVTFTVRAGRSALPAPAGPPATTRLGRDIGCVAAGLVLLVLGARLFVAAAVTAATALGVSDAVIGLTIVAAGTGLPEVAASVVATLRGERDMAVGNVVGSNLFNLLGILGVTGIVAGGRLPVAPSIEHFDLPVMVATACACLPLFVTGHRIDRWEGALFLFYYIAYSGYVVLAALQHDALPAVSVVMLEFVVPITIVTVLVLAVPGSGGSHGPDAARTR